MTAGPRAFSFLLALCVHAFVLGLLITALLLILLAPGVVTIPLAVVLLLLAILVRPRLGSTPKGPSVRQRADAPALFALLDRVAAEVGAQPATLAVISTEYNASYQRLGLRRTPVITLGLPLWDALTPQNRIAVLAHEFGHDVNGDSRHGLVVGSALRCLHDLHRALRPGARPTRGIALKAAQRSLQLVVAAIYKALCTLTLKAGQRAEYLADELSAKVAGPAAAAEALDITSTMGVTHATQVQRFALTGQPENFWTDRRSAFAAVPESEREQRRHLRASEQSRVDATHPPSSLRIAALHRLPDTAPRVELSPAEDELIQTELADDYPRVAQELVEAARSALYHWQPPWRAG